MCALATYRLRADWQGAGTYGGTLVDFTGSLLEVSWQRGRDFASQLVGRSVTGRLSALLNNEGSSFSPFNTASPLSGSLLPGRRVQIEGTVGGTSRVLWTGYLNSIVPEPDAKGLNTARMEAIGPLGWLNQRKVSMPQVSNMLTGSTIGTLLGRVGWSGGTLLDDGQTTLTRFWADKQQTISALRLPEETEAGFIVETKTGTIAFEDRHHRLKSPHTASVGTYTDDSTGTLVYSGLRQEDALASVFNVLEAEVRLFSTGTLGPLWSFSGTGANALVERDGGTLVLWAQYPNPDSPTQAIAADSWTTPVGTTDYTAHADAVGTGALLTPDVAVAVSAFSNALKMTFTNNNGTQDAYLTKLEVRGVPVNRDDPVKVNSEDSASQTKYGERTYPSPAQFLPNALEAQDWCRYNLALYKEPVPILSLTVDANRDTSHLAQAFDRDVSDRITVVGTGRAGLGVSQDFFIERESHSVDARRTHTVTWELSDAAKFSEFWVLGSSPLGTSSRLSF